MKLSLLVAFFTGTFTLNTLAPLHSMKRSQGPEESEWLSKLSCVSSKIILVALGLFYLFVQLGHLRELFTAEFCVMPYSPGLLMSPSVLPFATFCGTHYRTPKSSYPNGCHYFSQLDLMWHLH